MKNLYQNISTSVSDTSIIENHVLSSYGKTEKQKKTIQNLFSFFLSKHPSFFPKFGIRPFNMDPGMECYSTPMKWKYLSFLYCIFSTKYIFLFACAPDIGGTQKEPFDINAEQKMQ